MTGKIAAYGKTGGMVTLTDLPLFFWPMVFAWLGAGIFLVRFAHITWRYSVVKVSHMPVRFTNDAFGAVGVNRTVFVFILCATIALVFYDKLTEYIPHDLWSRTGLVMSGAFGGFFSILLLRAISLNHARFPPGTSPLKKWLAYLFIPPALFFFIWIAIVHGLGSAITRVAGSADSLKVVAAKEIVQSRRNCDYRMRAAELQPAFPSYLCLSELEYSRLPDKGAVILHGWRSPIGFVVSSWEQDSANESLQRTSTHGH